MPGAFPTGPEEPTPVQRAPRKKFVGRRTLEAQGKLKQNANSSVEETTAVVQSSECAQARVDIFCILISFSNAPPTGSQSDPDRHLGGS